MAVIALRGVFCGVDATRRGGARRARAWWVDGWARVGAFG